MARFDDLDRYYDPGLTLTVLGKEYTLPLPSAELGLWCRRMAVFGGELHAASTDGEMREAVDQAAARMSNLPALPGDVSFEERLLGPVMGEMTAAKVPDPYIQFCAQTAYVWIVGGEDAAARYWQSGGRPEAVGPANRQARRAAQRTSTGAGNATPKPASTSGTSSRRRSGRKGRGSGSAGRTS